ncbi:MAG: type IV secretion system family protein [Pseudomonadota bacterium]|nr:type IV secretion system family protein [Pseudomonadota bacterium]
MVIHHIGVVMVVACVALVPDARAQWAVIDVPAIAQLIQEVQTMQQQLATAREQLQSAQQAVQAITGGRGMERLLGSTNRNYLPSDWGQVMSVSQGQWTRGYANLSSDVRTVMAANAVLSPQRMSTLPAADRARIHSERRWSAMQQALAQEALSNSSNRFASIQSLIAAIPSAGDQKAILDLQARIGAELGMLQNEQTKLQVLYQATAAQESTIRQQAHERVIDAHGRFEARFQPTP